MTSSAPHPASPEARSEVVLGIIGGSGLYGMDELEEVEEVSLDTPFGAPSSPFVVGKLPRGAGPALRTVFVSRHDRGHVLTPGEINYRANIHGLKQLGVTHVLAVSAVGSLREGIAPGHAVVPDQLIDRTKHRESSFFGHGCVAHVQFGDPMDERFRAQVIGAAERVLEAEGTLGELHRHGTLVVMEGPAFSTRAESELYRRWGADIIGMTALPEAKLAREAELGYALLATSTDYDCWHLSEEEVTVEAVLAIMQANVARVRRIVLALAGQLPLSCAELPWPAALRGALSTDPQRIPAVTRERLDLIVGHYLNQNLNRN